MSDIIREALSRDLRRQNFETRTEAALDAYDALLADVRELVEADKAANLAFGMRQDLILEALRTRRIPDKSDLIAAHEHEAATRADVALARVESRLGGGK